MSMASKAFVASHEVFTVEIRKIFENYTGDFRHHIWDTCMESVAGFIEPSQRAWFFFELGYVLANTTAKNAPADDFIKWVIDYVERQHGS